MDQPAPSDPEPVTPVEAAADTEAVGETAAPEAASMPPVTPSNLEDSGDFLRRFYTGCFGVIALIAIGIAVLALVARDVWASLDGYLTARGLTHLPLTRTDRLSYEFLAVLGLILFVAVMLALFPVFLYRSFEQTKKARIQGDVWVDLMSLGYWTKLRLSAQASRLLAGGKALGSGHWRAGAARRQAASKSAAYLPVQMAVNLGLMGEQEREGGDEASDLQQALREFSRRFEESYGQQAFIWPLILVTVLYLLGWLAVLVPNGLGGGRPGAFLGGLTPLISKGFGGYVTQVLANLNVVSASFLGAYLFSIQGLFWRYVRSDFKPTAIMQASLRPILAGIVALVILVLSNIEDTPALTENSVKLLGFAAGLFPLQLLSVVVGAIVKKTLSVLPIPGMRRNTELTDLDGLDNWHADRLDEAGIRYARGLATADFLDLLISIRLPAETLVDWVDQALLRMHVNDERWKKIQEDTPVRTATDLLDAVDNEAHRNSLVRLIDGDRADAFATGLDILLESLERDPNIAYVRIFRDQQRDILAHDQAFPHDWPIQR